MAKKNGLNKMEQAKVAKMMGQEVPIGSIAKHFGTTVEVIKRFTPEKVAAAKAKAHRIEKQAKEASAKRFETVAAATAGAVRGVEEAAAKTVADTRPILDED